MEYPVSVDPAVNCYSWSVSSIESGIVDFRDFQPDLLLDPLIVLPNIFERLLDLYNSIFPFAIGTVSPLRRTLHSRLGNRRVRRNGTVRWILDIYGLAILWILGARRDLGILGTGRLSGLHVVIGVARRIHMGLLLLSLGLRSGRVVPMGGAMLRGSAIWTAGNCGTAGTAGRRRADGRRSGGGRSGGGTIRFRRLGWTEMALFSSSVVIAVVSAGSARIRAAWIRAALAGISGSGKTSVWCS